MVCLDDLVPADDDLRRIERLVDWAAVRSSAAPFYVNGGPGRPALDPAVLVKLALVLAWRGEDSMRAMLRKARTDLSMRRFLGFGLMEALPDHSTFSHAHVGALRSPRSSSSCSPAFCASAPTPAWSAGDGCWSTPPTSRLTPL